MLSAADFWNQKSATDSGAGAALSQDWSARSWTPEKAWRSESSNANAASAVGPRTNSKLLPLSPTFCTVGDSHQRRDSCESPALPPGERKYTLLDESGIVVRLLEVGYPEKYGQITW